MNESIKTFSLVVITICVFIITVIDILEMLEERTERLSLSGISGSRSLSAPLPEANPNQPRTTIMFNEMSFDFGEITEGETVQHTFTFENTGSYPLVISNAIGSCGCTVPTYPKEPVSPGEKAAIEVQFNSAGREGLQNKTITVTANTDPSPTVLSITARVKPKS
jgi:hypothetical protein